MCILIFFTKIFICTWLFPSGKITRNPKDLRLIIAFTLELGRSDLEPVLPMLFSYTYSIREWQCTTDHVLGNQTF